MSDSCYNNSTFLSLYMCYSGESTFAIDGLKCRCAKRVEKGTLHVIDDDEVEEEDGTTRE